MRARIAKISAGWNRVALVLMALLLIASCAKRETRQETSVTDSTALQHGQGLDRVEGPEPTPTEAMGPPVGKSDSLISALAPKLTPWVQMWRQADAGFGPDSLFRVGVAPAISGGSVQPLKNVYPAPPDKEAVFLILSAPSPDRRYNLIFDWYQQITESNGGIKIGGEPDHAPLLLDLRGSTANQFETCGTMCGYDWGVWLSPSTFALAGWQDARGNRKQGRIKVYSITDGTATTYVTRPVAAQEFSFYRSAWKEWVSSRFRAMKDATPRS